MSTLHCLNMTDTLLPVVSWFNGSPVDQERTAELKTRDTSESGTKHQLRCPWCYIRRQNLRFVNEVDQVPGPEVLLFSFPPIVAHKAFFLATKKQQI